MIADYQKENLLNPSLRTQWVKQQLATVMQLHYDGINIDFEDAIPNDQPDVRDAYTALISETYRTFKQANPHYQVRSVE
jgi:hypothetical protein